MAPFIEINGRRVGPGHPTYVIAELSANHNQRFDQAVQLVRAAKEVGADAVKLQTYTPDTLTIRSNMEHFRIRGGTLWDGRTLYDLYAAAYMPWEWQPELKEIAAQVGIDLFSTAYDTTAADFLAKMDVPAYKVASFENVDLPLIEYIAGKGRPMIVSTGMASLGEIEDAVQAAQRGGATQLALLKCTSAYPSPPDEMHLRAIPHLTAAFGVPVGLSDHTLGIAVAIAAVALGACVVEKHLTLSRSSPSADAAFSLEPGEFRVMVQGIREAEHALGEVRYGPSRNEARSLVFRRSLFVVRDVKAGEVLTEANIRSIRPGYGLASKFWNQVIGRRAATDIPAGTPLSWGLIGGNRA